MRIDLFLKNSRIIKRRTIAKQACSAGRVLINDKMCKAGDEVNIGDIIEVRFGSNSPKFRVKEILSTSNKDNMDKMVEVVD
ncbi:MAG: RNA-binding S4 domain-containing protein [Tissierellia bacterium]|nr:RNA-binding S4 domain-containing protein [Tissierellia bacterium]